MIGKPDHCVRHAVRVALEHPGAAECRDEVFGTFHLGHAMRALEERIGVRLLNRTTRGDSPTEAGFSCLAAFSRHLPLSTSHCIGHRMPSGKLYRWEFERQARNF